MKKPQIVMLKKGSKIKAGDLVIREDAAYIIKKFELACGNFVHGPNNCYMTEGYYFRITWKEV